LRQVETKAQGQVNGTSGRGHECEDSGKEPQVAITSSKPLGVVVVFDRYLFDRSGIATKSGPVFQRAHTKDPFRNICVPQ
jgi:hypothetical protein